MRNKTYLLSIAVLALTMTGCSDSADNNDGTKPTATGDAMAFTTKVEGAVTRAVNFSYYASNTTLKVGVLSNDKAIDNAINGKRTTTLTVNGEGANQTVTSNPVLYWNDLGGKDADVNVWGVNIQNQNVNVTERGALSWKAEADQTAGVTPYDLHWSNNVKNLKFKNTADMEFHHAMSKITIHLTVGEGFTAEDAKTTKITLPKQFTTCDADAANAKLTNIAGETTVTPHVLTDFNGGMTATYEAIVVPSRHYEVNDQIAAIALGKNEYNMKSKETRTFESGKNYIYYVSVKKSGVAFVSSVIVDWEDVEGSADAEIKFSATGTNGEDGTGSNALNNSTHHFDVFTSGDNSDYDGDKGTDGTQPSTSVSWVEPQGTPGTPDYVPGHWENDTPIFWEDDDDDTFFRALSTTDGETPESDGNGNFDLTAGNNDYIWGTSGEEAINPNTGKVELKFKHIMSKVVITVVTTNGDDAVDLSTITDQFLSNIATTASFNIGTGEYAPFTNANYGNYNLKLEEIPGTNKKKYTFEFYAFPQTLNNNAMFNITVGNAPQNNTFTKQMNTITADGQAINKWEAGKRYVYTILLKKTEKRFSVMLTDWEDVIADETEAEL